MAADDMLARLQRLEDVEAIETLMAIYCDICDDAHNSARIVEIFTEDGTWERDGVGGHSAATGRAKIGELFAAVTPRVAFSQHNIFNSRVTVEGDRATGTWYLLGPFVFADGDVDSWVAARYDNEFRRIDGAWKLHHLKSWVRMNTPYKEGWADPTRRSTTCPSFER